MPIKKTEGVEFRIDVTGESGEQYKGRFRALPRLSHRLELEKDRKRRDLLGREAGIPSERAVIYANVIAELSVRLVEWPKWWPEVGFGLDLEDEEPLVEIQNGIQEILAAHQKEVAERGKAAEDELRKKIESAPQDDE